MFVQAGVCLEIPKSKQEAILLSSGGFVMKQQIPELLTIVLFSLGQLRVQLAQARDMNYWFPKVFLYQ